MEQRIKPDEPTKRSAKVRKWYKKNLWIIIFLIVFWPVGVYLMWRYTAWKKPVKIVLSVIELLLFAIFVMAIMNPAPYITLDNSYYSAPKTDDSKYLVSGIALSKDTVKINGVSALRSGDDFRLTIPLKEGDNQISVVATDGSMEAKKSFIIHRNTSSEIKTREDAAAAAKKAADEAAAKKIAADEAKAKADAAAKAKAAADVAAAKAKADAAAAAAAAIANASAEQKSALAQATSYANTQYMSKQGVYDQLVSPYGGQFTADAAQFAIDHVVADWNANALQTARDYQNQQNLSPAAIYDQLTSQYGEQFTPGQADYAIQHLNG